MVGGREGIRPPDPLLAKQVLSQLSYTPTREAVLILKHFPTFLPLHFMASSLDRARTVHLSPHCTRTVLIGCAATGLIYPALRLCFSNASRHIRNFICEYFLKTCASP